MFDITPDGFTIVYLTGLIVLGGSCWQAWRQSGFCLDSGALSYLVYCYLFEDLSHVPLFIFFGEFTLANRGFVVYVDQPGLFWWIGFGGATLFVASVVLDSRRNLTQPESTEASEEKWEEE